MHSTSLLVQHLVVYTRGLCLFLLLSERGFFVILTCIAYTCLKVSTCVKGMFLFNACVTCVCVCEGHDSVQCLCVYACMYVLYV